MTTQEDWDKYLLDRLVYENQLLQEKMGEEKELFNLLKKFIDKENSEENRVRIKNKLIKFIKKMT